MLVEVAAHRAGADCQRIEVQGVVHSRCGFQSSMTAFGARLASCNQTAWSNGSNKKARFAPALFCVGTNGLHVRGKLERRRTSAAFPPFALAVSGCPASAS